MANFFLSFDLEDADSSSYDLIYRWVHGQGGYRYVPLEGGDWGRLPSTCVVLPYDTEEELEAAHRFKDGLRKEFGFRATHVSAVRGTPSGVSRIIRVPEYVHSQLLARLEHAIRKIDREA